MFMAMSECSVESSRCFPGVRTGWVGCLVGIPVVEIFAGCRPDLACCGFGVGTGTETSVLSNSSGVGSGVERSSLSCWETEGSDSSMFSSTGVSGGVTISLGRTSGSAGRSAMVHLSHWLITS